MLNLYEYNILSFHKKGDYTWKHGVLLHHREAPSHTYCLYAVHDFFVEVTYYQLQVTAFKSFKTSRHLKPYLEHIHLTELF